MQTEINSPQPEAQPTPQPKEAWTPPVLQKTPIAETAGKTDVGGDGLGIDAS
ncbi:MAG: hypothetical protein KF893_13335 [Caldilineaceae bacterium]|nr:hypothetical protein [Caldilineaceae bacterium]